MLLWLWMDWLAPGSSPRLFQSISLLPPVSLITTHTELPVLLLLARVGLVSASITSAHLLSPKSTPLVYSCGAGNKPSPVLRPWYLGAVSRLWEDLRSAGRSAMSVTSFAELSLLWQSEAVQMHEVSGEFGLTSRLGHR